MKTEKTIESLQKEIEDLTHKLEVIREDYRKKAMDFSGTPEIENLSRQIADRKNRIEAIRLEVLSDIRTHCLEEAESLAQEKKTLLERIAAIDVKGQKLLEEFEKNIPVRRVQTSTNQYIKVEKTYEKREITGYQHIGLGKEEPIYKATPMTIFQEIPVLDVNIRGAEENGWKICDGQEIKPEPLTAENSRLFPMASVPDVFQAFNDTTLF